MAQKEKVSNTSDNVGKYGQVETVSDAIRNVYCVFMNLWAKRETIAKFLPVCFLKLYSSIICTIFQKKIVWTECLHYVAPNAVTNINTLMSLSSLLNVFTFLLEGQKNWKQIVGVQNLGVKFFGGANGIRVLMSSVKRESPPYTEDVSEPYCFTSLKRENSYFRAILNSALVFSLSFTTIRHRSAWIPPCFFTKEVN